MENQGPRCSRSRRLVLFPLPMQGHINPMLQLANILHSKGFSITVVHTHFNSPDPSRHPNFTFHGISDGLSDSEASTADVVSILSLLIVKCVEPFRDCLAGLLDAATQGQEPIACLITDAMWHFTQAVADGLKLRRIVLRTSSVCSFVVFARLPLMLEKGYLTKRESQLESAVPELPPLRIKDLPGINSQDPQKVHQLLDGMIRQTKASSGLIWNSFEDLEQSALATIRQEFPIPNFPIGPFNMCCSSSSSSLLPPDQTSISWLNTQAPKSVIYVSFGSIAAMDETEFLEIASGLAYSGQPFLWVVRPGLVHGSEWLGPLPDGFAESIGGRGRIVNWAPQQEVLSHSAIGGFWTHNGWNSTLESICEGVPMICLPYFGDQTVNARYASHVWRVGVELEGGRLDRKNVEDAIRRLMSEKEGEELRERAVHLKEKATSCLDEGGSSYKALESLIAYILSF